MRASPGAAGANWSGFYALDIDHPGVQDYLKRVFEDVFSMYGNDYDLVKLDFLYAAAPFGTDRETRAGRMYRAMEMLRKWCGRQADTGLRRAGDAGLRRGGLLPGQL